MKSGATLLTQTTSSHAASCRALPCPRLHHHATTHPASVTGRARKAATGTWARSGVVARGHGTTSSSAMATQTYSSSSSLTSSLDVEELHRRLEAKAQAMVSMEEESVKTRPKVKFVLGLQVGLGESWKIVGKCSELGNFELEVAPFMKWSHGDAWTLEVPIRPGTFLFKAVLRKPDGAYIWESGPDRTLEVPPRATANDVIQLELNDVKLPH